MMKRKFSWIIYLILFLVFGWSGLWYAGRIATDWAIREIETRSAFYGEAISCNEHEVSGFPLTLEIKCSTAQLNSKRGIQADIAEIQSAALLYKPGSIITKANGPVHIRLPIARPIGQNMTANWQDAQINIKAHLSGISHTTSHIKNVEISLDPQDNSLLLEQIKIKDINLDFHPHLEHTQNFEIVFYADQLGIRRAGSNLPAINVKIVGQIQNIGKTIQFNPVLQFQSWLDNGGVVNIEIIKIESNGFVANINGNLHISSQHLISGKLNIELNNINELPALILEIAPRFHESIEQIVNSLKTINSDSLNRITIPLTIQDNNIRTGLIPLGQIPAMF